MASEKNSARAQERSLGARYENEPAMTENPAKQLMNRALKILDASEEPLAAVHLEQAIQSLGGPDAH